MRDHLPGIGRPRGALPRSLRELEEYGFVDRTICPAVPLYVKCAPPA
jgi:DNA-binding HxlR family transcriptional regulator